MTLRGVAALLLSGAAVTALVCASACDSFDDGGSSPAPDASAADGPSSVDGTAPTDAGTSTDAEQPVPPISCKPQATITLVERRFPPQSQFDSHSCIANDGFAHLGQGLAGYPVDGGDEVKGCTSMTFDEPIAVARVAVDVDAELASECNGLPCNCDGGAASLWLLYSNDDQTWQFVVAKASLPVGLSGSITYDLQTSIPPVRALALCRQNADGPVLRVGNPRITCR